MFSDCIYDTSPYNLGRENIKVYQAVTNLSQAFRKLFRNLIARKFDVVASIYRDIILGFNGITELPPCAWCPEIDQFFQSLAEFLVVKFTVKESSGADQWEFETCAANILSESCTQHIHEGCPFHIEDNFTHCCMCMLRIVSRHSEFSPDELFRKAICALFHDIGKLNSLTRSKRGRVAYPCHCLAGSITLRHMWGAHFLPWFTPHEYDRMCDTVLYHMCGINRDSIPPTITGLSQLPAELRADLCDLARADVSGAFPYRSFLSEVPCLGEDAEGVKAMSHLGDTCSLGGVCVDIRMGVDIC